MSSVAARALLAWSQADLADRSGISEPTAARLEAADGELGGHEDTTQKLRAAIEAAGVEFIDANGGGRGHHREVHRAGNEALWWENAGIDALLIAHKLWTETHPLRIPPIATGEDVALSAASAMIENLDSSPSPANKQTGRIAKRSQLPGRPT